MDTALKSATVTADEHSGLLQAAALAAGASLFIVGAGMVALAFAAYVSVGRFVAEAVIGVIVTGGGGALLLSALKGQPRSKAAALIGDATLLGSLFYLGTVLPPFNHHAVGRTVANLQFIAVILAITIGTAAIALTPAPEHNFTGWKHIGQIALAGDGVVLVAGTILLGIGLGQLDKAALMPPKWSWISFLGLTVPGMIVLVMIRGAVKKLGPTERTLGWQPKGIWVLLGWELLLVAGLGVMIYGALYNLVLGANGFTGGFKGNTNGLLLWATAAAFLIFVRGPFERVLIRLQERRRFPAVREALYVVGAFAFIVGERSVISGKAPTLATGAAFPIAFLIILAAALLLVPIRLVTKPAELGKPEPHVVEAAGAEA
ncbi:MAG: hypothetical protein ACR2M3_12125 [Thermomicrobiales bacterium]